jgi:hypothetical protein
VLLEEIRLFESGGSESLPLRQIFFPAPFESPFAPSAVSTFTTNFVLVTVDNCYVRIAHITLKIKIKDEELVNPTAPRSSYR